MLVASLRLDSGMRSKSEFHMRSRNVTVFLLGTCFGLALAVVWNLTTGSEGRGPVGGVAQPGFAAQSEPAVDRSEGLATLQDGDRARSRVPVDSSKGPAESNGPREESNALADALGGLPARALPTEEELEQRFGDLGLPQLEGALRGLLWVRHLEVQPILDRKMATGQYRVDIVPTGSELEQPGSFPDGTPRAARHEGVFLDNGMTEYHTAEVHQSELFDLMVRDKEIEWIGRRRARLSKDAERASSD